MLHRYHYYIAAAIPSGHLDVVHEGCDQFVYEQTTPQRISIGELVRIVDEHEATCDQED
jgi:hypothetical protein